MEGIAVEDVRISISSKVSSPKLYVLVVDDHELIRFSLKLALQRQPHIELVGLASNGQEAIEMTREYCPDVVILDSQMFTIDGINLFSQIKNLCPQVQIVAYSSVRDPSTEVTIQSAKADAFYDIEAPLSELIEMIPNLVKRT